MTTTTISGLPDILRHDAWWLDETPAEGGGPSTAQRPAWRPVWVLGALVILADLLIYGTRPGIGLSAFCLCLIAVAGWGSPRAGRSLGLTLLAVLPWTEQPQLLSFLFLAFGTLAAAALIAAPSLQLRPMLLLAATRLSLCLPVAALGDLYRWLNAAPPVRVDQRALGRAVRDWGLPLGGALVFGLLFIAANPLFDWLGRLLEALSLPAPDRVTFWMLAALAAWPFLTLPRFRERLRAAAAPIRAPRLPGLVNAGSVARSLVVLNALFAVQTLSDAAYLWGGAALPAGMTHAEYAHRGAYPLLVAALLAGVFAIVAQNHLAGRRVLRGLLFLWIVQTALLVASAALRLDLYVEVYGLTRLRLSAAIWMATVMAGLALLSFQMTTGRTVAWLLSVCAWLGLGVLYAALFLSFDRTIAAYNLSHDVRADRYYLCQLGRAAKPVILAHDRATGSDTCDGLSWYTRAAPPDDLRAWGFREWRTERSLAVIQSITPKAIAP